MANTNKLIDIDRLSEYNDKIQEQIKNAGGEKDFTIEFSEYLSQYTYTVFDSSTEVYKTCQEIMNYRKETGKNPKIYVKWLQDYNTNEAIYEVFDIYISNKDFRFTTNKSSVSSDEGIYSQFISIEAVASNYIITSPVYISLGFAAREAFLYDANAMYNQKQKRSSALGLENTARYTPTSDYHPATKKYVDDMAGLPTVGGDGVFLQIKNLSSNIYRVLKGSHLRTSNSSWFTINDDDAFLMVRITNNATGVRNFILWRTGVTLAVGSTVLNEDELVECNDVDLNYYLPRNNTTSYSVVSDYNPAHKKYVDDKPTTYTGYDATKTQVLKNINGTLTWETIE